MKSPEYYIADLELKHEPNTDDVTIGGVDVEFEVLGEPEYVEEEEALKARFGFQIDMVHFEENDGDDEPEQKADGSIDSEVLCYIEGDENEFSEHIDVWIEDGYRSVDWDFRFLIESGFMSGVISRISALVENSFRGILPQMSLTQPPQDGYSEFTIDSEEEVSLDDEDLADALTQALGEQVGDQELEIKLGRPDSDEDTQGDEDDETEE
ncbi:hypothetical protein ACFQL9_13395 [Halobaculum lipolyticum]|uniref:Uncharacterized protein n=1 Tax=Halobaculum lipolyticum TaxID=3032001 RepID=A0ABD5WJG2_9EURY